MDAGHSTPRPDRSTARRDVPPPRRGVSAAPDTLAILRRVVASARALAHVAAAALLLYEPEADRFVPVVPRVAEGLDERWLQSQGLVAFQTLAQRAGAGREIVVVPDTTATPDLDVPLLAGGRRPGAVAVAPLITADGTVVGALGLSYAVPHREELDRETVHALADLAALAIAVARTQEHEHAMLRRLQALDQASALLAADLAPQSILRQIVEVATELVGARYGALGLAGEDGYLADFLTVGLSEEERAALGPLPRGHGLLGILIREGQPLRLPDIWRDPRRIGFPPHHPPMTSLLGVPIRVQGEVVGSLYLTDKIGAPEFSAEDQQVIELLATHAGIAIHNAQLYTRERHAHQLLQEQSATLREQAQLIDLAHDAILVRDLESRVVQWNGGAAETYGWTAPEARGQVTHTLLQTRFPVSLREVEAALQQSGQWEGELEHARRDGTRLVVESRHALLRDADGQPAAILEINREITQRKRAEAALRLLAESGTLLESTLDEEAVLAAIVRLVVPALADRCALYLRDATDAGTVRRRAEVPAPSPAEVETEADAAERRDQPDPDPVDLATERAIGAVLRTGQPELITAATEADPAAGAAGAAGADAEAEAPARRHGGARGLVSSLLVPLAVQGQTLGVLVLATTAEESGRRYTAEDLSLAQDLARRAGLALTNARLHRQMQEVALLRERERIGRDLHDSVIQDLYALTLELDQVAEDAPDHGQRERLQTLEARLGRVMGDIRAYVQGAPAPALQHQPLAAALAGLAQEVEGQGQIGVTVTYQLVGEPLPLPAATEAMLLQIAREALSNVVKHARARQVQVRLAYRAGAVDLTIGDDGRGFVSDAQWGAEHRGLRNLRARAAEAGGTLTLQSAPGSGTTVQVSVPREPLGAAS